MRSFLPPFLGDVISPLLTLLSMILLSQPSETLGSNIPLLRSAKKVDLTGVEFFINENAETGTVVGILKQHLPFLKPDDNLRFQIYNFGPVSNSDEQWSTSNSANDSESIFQIDSVSSVISVADSLGLDREKLCPFASGTEKECALNCGVSVTRADTSASSSPPEQSWIQVKIVINDVNDCAPQFTYDSMLGCKTVDLPEDTPVGTKVYLLDALDLDSFQNSRLIYRLNCQNGPKNPFALYQIPRSSSSDVKNGGANSIQLQLQYPLDYEGLEGYNCTITVCDNGTPILCSTMPLCLTVHDVNDNGPVFLDQNASLVLNEDTPIGSRITKLNATDADSGIFGSIRYALVGDLSDSLSSQKYFRLDPITGDLFLTSSLRGGTKFHFLVEARDRGKPESRMSRSSLSIYVLDVNNHSPKISIVPAAAKIKKAGDQYNSESSIKSVLSRVTKVPCSFAGYQDSKVCEESSEQSSLVQVFEDNIAPTNLAFIRVSDNDVGENAQVDCKLYTQSEIPIEGLIRLLPEHKISSSSIVYKLVLEAMLDCEVHSHAKGSSICNSAWTIPVKIECRDHGTPTKTSILTIFIQILDNNEFAPIFEKEVYRTTVKESIPIGSNILQVSVTDADSVLQGALTLSEQHNSGHIAPLQTLRYEVETLDHYLPFAVDSQSGRIYTIGELDAENTTEYAFKVKAINTGADNETLTSTCQVIVDVQNVNDNPPIFLPPHVVVGSLVTKTKGTVIRIPENLPIGTLFMQLQTYDPDGNDNAMIRLDGCIPQVPQTSTQLKGLAKPSFEVDKKSGKCWTASSLDRETLPSYLCTITAVDEAISSALTSTLTLTIEVTDENDNSPIWLYPRAPDDSRIQIGVEFPVNKIITRIRAVDADSGANARIVYSLEDSSFVHFNHDRTCNLSAYFALESTSGHLRMRERINSCIIPGDSVRLLIRATDEGIPQLSKDAEFFLEFKLGSEVLNTLSESTFLTQADEAFANKLANLESQIHESLYHTNVASPTTIEEKTDTFDTKRMQIFALMIIVPLAAILLCCCLVTVLYFVIRPRRSRESRREKFKKGCTFNELEVFQADNGTNIFSSTDASSSRTKSPAPSVSQMTYSADVRSICSQQKFSQCCEQDLAHTIARIHADDSISVHNEDNQADGKLIYPIYLKPIAEAPIASIPAIEEVIRLSSIPELEGTILVPLPRHSVTPSSIAISALNYHPISKANVLMACTVPDADKSSADSGKGQSDDDVFSRKGIQLQDCLPSSSFICVPVGPTDVEQVTIPSSSPTAISVQIESPNLAPLSTPIPSENTLIPSYVVQSIGRSAMSS